MTLPAENDDLPPRPARPEDRPEGMPDDLPTPLSKLPPPAHPEPAAAEPGGQPGPARRAPYARISAAWSGVWAGAVAVILLIIFIGQNTAKVPINFLWMHGLIPVALALLIAG